MMMVLCVIGIVSAVNFSIDGAFIAATVAGIASMAAWLKARKNRKRQADKLETTATSMASAAADVTAAAQFMQSMFDDHKRTVFERLDSDRVVWVGGLSAVNRRLDRMSENHDALLGMLAEVEAKLPISANKGRKTTVTKTTAVERTS